MYETTLAAFYRLPAYDRNPTAETHQDVFDLSRFQRFLDKVGNPEKGLPVVHVTGSKGKGSTVAFIGAGLQGLGKRAGVFMSPYIQDPRESIYVDGKPIPKEVFSEMMTGYLKIIDQMAPNEMVTSFEILTAMALQYFHDQDVDFALMETGLGGRLDATNVVESPILSIICPIEKEHTEVLGDSITSIAYEKLGIVRDETPVIMAHQDNFVLEFARSVCQQKRSSFLVITGTYAASVLNRSTEGYSFALKTPSREIPRITLSLLGDHQINNSITAWAALDTLIPEFDPGPVLDVWAHLTLPGRFQQATRDNRHVIWDAAHTLGSARALRRTLDELYPNSSITFILGFFNDKNIEGFVRDLVRWGDAVVITQVNHPRAMPARLVEERLRTVMPKEQVTSAITNNVRIAWQKALKMSKSSPICVTGSFQLMGAV
ncbi:MAG: Mur ligase family protein [Candidatus Peregrinibacteria bacterium]|nr:Mur ligase family protein [Candidatus Peregrinibacteria bacterium]